MKAPLVVVLLSLILINTLAQELPLSSGAERLALLNLRSSLGIRSKEWPIKADPCSFWVGVQCLKGRVVGIKLAGLKRTFQGSLNTKFAVDSLSNFSLLASFNSSGFALPGFIPDWFGGLAALKSLDLRYSSVIGSIPPSLGNLNVSVLYLSHNSLSGIIPSALGQLTELEVLDISHNLLSGRVPAELISLEKLISFDLSSNFLSDIVPPELAFLSNIKFVNLSNNNFTGTIPKLSSLFQLIELDLSSNHLSGSLPTEDLRGLRSLQKLVIRDNNLEGSLPDDLFFGSMPELHFLDVSGNNLTGELSSARVNATKAVFNLSNNMFYGDLDFSLSNFRLIDLSGNYFQGMVSDDVQNKAKITRNCLRAVQNQRSLDDCRFFYANRDLTFDWFGAPSPSLPPRPGRAPKSKQLIPILAGMFGGVAFIVLLVFLLLAFLRKCNKGFANQRGNANVRPVPEGGCPTLHSKVPVNLSGLGESFTYEQMLQSTSDFSDTNLIKHGHSGDLFRGVLDGEIPIVIKRVDLLSLKKESYTTELDFFSKASHTRLISLLGHCLEHEREKFLVYKYMPNGDLSNSLHRPANLDSDGLKSLDWITRLKIAIGAAEGLSYLHHDCIPPLVHRDVQASSILLDDKFEVRLGSLSELLAQEGEPHQNAITWLLRMPQTSEQKSSGLLSDTCAYDVYCFGKVLLGLVTGKIGISKSDDDTTKEWLDQTLPYISIHDKESVTKIIDPSLIVDDDFLEEVWAMAIIARSCLNPKPSKRPLIRYVLKSLENPLKVVREDHSGLERSNTASSRRSWSAVFFGSWRHENATGGLVGINSSSLNRRMSNEIFPEPVEMQDIERVSAS